MWVLLKGTQSVHSVCPSSFSFFGSLNRARYRSLFALASKSLNQDTNNTIYLQVFNKQEDVCFN